MRLEFAADGDGTWVKTMMANWNRFERAAGWTRTDVSGLLTLEVRLEETVGKLGVI